MDGTWVSKEHLRFPLDSAEADAPETDVVPTVDAATVNTDRLRISAVGGEGSILPGSAPISYRLESVSGKGMYWPNSATYVITEASPFYTWVSEVHDFSPRELNAADLWPSSAEYPYAKLQDRPWLERARGLAAEITAGTDHELRQGQGDRAVPADRIHLPVRR